MKLLTLVSSGGLVPRTSSSTKSKSIFGNSLFLALLDHYEQISQVDCEPSMSNTFQTDKDKRLRN